MGASQIPVSQPAELAGRRGSFIHAFFDSNTVFHLLNFMADCLKSAMLKT
jgi:hypothetical protein